MCVDLSVCISPGEIILSSRSLFSIRNYFGNILSAEGNNGIDLVIENDCGSLFSFRINGPDAIWLGPGDHHDLAYDEYQVVGNASEIRTIEGCGYRMVGIRRVRDCGCGVGKWLLPNLWTVHFI